MRFQLKNILLIFSLIFLTNSALFAQKIESLQEELFTHLDQHGNDTTSLRLAKQIYLEAIEINPLTAGEFAALGQQIATELGDSIEIGIMYGYAGNALLKQKIYFMAMENHFKAYEIFARFGDQKNLANSLLNIGKTYLAQEIFSIAEDKTIEAKEIYIELGDKAGEAKALKYLGLINMSLDEDVALEYFEQALEILSESSNSLEIAQLKIYMAKAYKQLFEIELALQSIQEALDILENTDNEIKIAEAFFLYGEIFLEDENFNEAENKYKKALFIFEKHKSLEYTSLTYERLAKVFYLEENYPKAIVFANNGLENAQNFNYLPILRDIYYILSNSYAALNDFETAYSLQEKHAEMLNQIYAQKQQSQFSDFQMNLETQNKEREIDLLKIQAEKDKLSAAKKQYRRNTIFVLVIALLILIFIIGLYIRFREKSKSNKLLQDSNAQLKTEVEERKIAQIELQNSEERYRLVFRKTPIGILQFDENLKITDANDKFSEIFNISIDEMVGTELNTIFDRNSVYGFNDALNSKDGEAIKIETEIITNGQVVYISLTIKPYSYNTKNGKVRGGVVIIEDLTERKKAEKYYNKNVLRKQALVDLFPDKLIFIKKDGEIISSHIPNSPETEANSKNISEILPENTVNVFFNEVNVATKKQKSRKFVLKDDKNDQELLIKIVPDQKSNALIIITDYHDLTEKNIKLSGEIENELKKSKKKSKNLRTKYNEQIYKDIEKELLPVYQNIQKQLSFIVLRGFAEKIIIIGNKHNNRQLKDYGNILLEYITTFNVMKVNDTLSEFPSLVSEFINQTPDF